MSISDKDWKTIEQHSQIDDEYDNLIRPTMMIFKVISLWPSRKDLPISAVSFRKCRLLLLSLMFLLMSTSLTIDVIHHIDDLDEFMECALFCIIFYAILSRIVICTLHQKYMLCLIETMKQDWIYSSYEERIILREKCLFAFRLGKYFIILVAVNVIVFTCVPILQIYFLGLEQRMLPFRGFFLVNQTVSPVYEYLYAFNVMIGCFGGAVIASVNSFNLVIITHGSAKFAILRRKLEALNSDNPNVDRMMVECVKRHQDAIAFADVVQRVINILISAQLISNICEICLSGLQISMLIENKARLQYLIYLIGAVLELFMFSFSGNTLLDESDAVSESAYNSDWIGGAFVRNLQIVMMRSRIPSRVMVANFYSMSLQSFSKVLNMSTSYLMALMVMRNK